MKDAALPEKFWHCYVKPQGGDARNYAIVNDLSLEQLMAEIIGPWMEARPLRWPGR
jgi:hypothetical protein